MNRSCITWKIRGAVQVYDSFTTRPANLSHLRVLTEAGISVIKKEGGILVFAENGRETAKNPQGVSEISGKEEDPIRVRLESPIFLAEELILFSHAENLPVCLRMHPQKAYPAPSHASAVYGQCLPEAEVFFVFEDLRAGAGDGYEKKLLCDISPQTQAVEIYHPGRRSLEGEWIELSHGQYREYLLLGRMENPENGRSDAGRYLICGQKVSGTYPRLETALRLVYSTRADRQGEYILYFRQVPGGTARGRICIQAGSIKHQEAETEREITIQQGEKIRLDLLQYRC